MAQEAVEGTTGFLYNTISPLLSGKACKCWIITFPFSLVLTACIRNILTPGEQDLRGTPLCVCVAGGWCGWFWKNFTPGQKETHKKKLPLMLLVTVVWRSDSWSWSSHLIPMKEQSQHTANGRVKHRKSLGPWWHQLIANFINFEITPSLIYLSHYYWDDESYHCLGYLCLSGGGSRINKGLNTIESR